MLKNYSKGAFMILAVLFLCAGTVAAQDSLKATPEARAKGLTEKMKTELTLSDDQYNKVYAINLEYAQKNQAIMKGTGNKLSKFQTLKSQNEAKTKELKAVLTKEQFDKYQKMQKELKEGLREAADKRGRLRER